MPECANEMELSAKLNAICANVPRGKAQCNERLSHRQDYSWGVIDSTQLDRGYAFSYLRPYHMKTEQEFIRDLYYLWEYKQYKCCDRAWASDSLDLHAAAQTEEEEQMKVVQQWHVTLPV